VRSVDPGQFKFVIAIAADKDLILRHLTNAPASVEVIQARPALDYMRLGGLRSRAKAVQSAGARWALLRLLTLIEPLANLPWTMRMIWIVLSRKVDLVQFNNAFVDDQLIFVTRITRRPPVVFIRGHPPIGRFARRFLLPHVRACVSVSEHVKADAVADGVPADTVFVATPPAIPAPVSPTARHDVRARYGIPLSSVVIGIFGRVVAWKGQLEFMRAAARVLERIPGAHVLVVGDSSDGGEGYMARVVALVEGHSLQRRVTFTGYVSDVDAHYQAVDLVVHTSVQPEPSGRVVFEAMSNRVPLIVSSLGGPKEFIDDGVDGYVVDPQDTPLLASRMERLLLDSELRKAMANRAENKLHRLYGPEAYGRKVMQAYRLALGAEPPEQRESTPLGG